MDDLRRLNGQGSFAAYQRYRDALERREQARERVQRRRMQRMWALTILGVAVILAAYTYLVVWMAG